MTFDLSFGAWFWAVAGTIVGLLSMEVSYANGQKRDIRGELDIFGNVKEISVSPVGEIWLSTATGKTYHCDRIHGDWVSGGLEVGDGPFNYQAIERISFFDSKRAIASGRLNPEGENMNWDLIYRTEDGGQTWTAADFGVGQWIYDAFVKQSGEAWIGGSSGLLVYSSDFGKTWTYHRGPFNGDSRLNAIWVSAENRILAGALENYIRISTDRGLSWQDIPTPLDQELYEKNPEPSSDNRILNIAEIGKYTVVNQDGLVFWSPSDDIQWKQLTDERLVMFEVAGNGNELLALTDGGHLILLDKHLKPIRPGPGKLQTGLVDVAWANDRWFFLDVNYGMHEWGGNRLAFSYPYTSKILEPEIRLARKSGRILWGASTNHVYQSRNLGKTWDRVGFTHFRIMDFFPADTNNLILWDGQGRNGTISGKTGRVKTVPSLEGYDVIGMLSAPGGLIAYGGMSYESPQRVDVSRTFHPGEFAGTRDKGFVILSQDRGKTWQLIDEWQNGGVAKLDVHPDGGFGLLSYLGSIRRVTKSDRTYHGKDILIADGKNRDKVPYTQVPEVFVSLDDQTTLVTGWTHWLGNRAYLSADACKTWNPVSQEHFPYQKIIRLGDTLIGLHREMRQICRIEDRNCRPVFRLADTDPKSLKITDISVTGKDRLLVEISEYGEKDGRDVVLGKIWKTVKTSDPN